MRLSSPQALRSVVDLGFQYNLPPFPTVSGHRVPVFIPIIFKSSSTSFLLQLHGLPLLTSSFHYRCCSCFWYYLFYILSAWPYHISWRDFINFTESSHFKISSVLLFFYCYPAFSFNDSMYFPYSHSLKYSDHVCLFRGRFQNPDTEARMAHIRLCYIILIYDLNTLLFNHSE